MEEPYGDKDQNCHNCFLECENEQKLKWYFVEVRNSVPNNSALKVQSIKIVFVSLCHFLPFMNGL